MAEPIALAALAVEAAVGYPDALYRRAGHPVGWFARLIGLCERRWNRPALGSGARRLLGVLTVLLLLGVAGGGALAIERLTRAVLPAPFDWVALALLAVAGLAQRSLHDHVAPVRDALCADDLPVARRAVAHIVGRDTGRLNASGIARAATESLAESFNDGIVAPAFWLAVGGLPGLYAYKAINTADSLIGHREPRYRAFGWAAARTDDLMNLVPARLAGVLVVLAGRGGWRVMFRDAARHASPNSGWPEAAMAGALGCRLGGPVAYDGVLYDKPWLGDGRSAGPVDIGRALAIYRRACAGLWILAGAVAWAL